ncbi:MAG TPA: hypothetical protein VH639_13935 [Bryobacteraceae bacterium]|jgi:hypothetical protein
MIRYVYDFLAAVQGAVVLAVIVLLLLGPLRRFWVVFAHAFWAFVGTVGLTVFDILRSASHVALYAHAYWINEVVLDLLLFLVVIVLTHTAAPEGELRQKIDRLLLLVAAAMIALPFLAFHPRFHPWPTAQWFNSTGEILNFGAAIMNLALWGALIATRRDPQLLKVSAGLGIRLTGTALSYGVRHFIPLGTSNLLPNLFLMLTQLAGWSILCWAFWPAAKARHPVESVAASP